MDEEVSSSSSAESISEATASNESLCEVMVEVESGNEELVLVPRCSTVRISIVVVHTSDKSCYSATMIILTSSIRTLQLSLVVSFYHSVNEERNLYIHTFLPGPNYIFQFIKVELYFRLSMHAQ